MSKVYTKPTIWIVDTSVFCNILDIPDRNQNRKAVIDQFSSQIKRGDSHMLPFTSVLETGNHIGQLSESGHRKKYAQLFVDTVSQSIQGDTPWRPIAFPGNEELLPMLIDFPNQAEAGKGFGDHLIIKQWEEICTRLRAYTVKIWSTDQHLAGYECNH